MRNSLTDIGAAPPSPCPDAWFACGDGECIEGSQVCDFTPHCHHGEDEAGCRKTDVSLNPKEAVSLSHPWLCPSAAVCDFDGESCGWLELTPGDGFDWVRGTSAEVPPQFYGYPPPLDHTTNSTGGKEAGFSLFSSLHQAILVFYSITICSFHMYSV